MNERFQVFTVVTGPNLKVEGPFDAAALNAERIEIFTDGRSVGVRVKPFWFLTEEEAKAQAEIMRTEEVALLKRSKERCIKRQQEELAAYDVNIAEMVARSL